MSIRFPRKHVADSVAERIIAAERRINANPIQQQSQALDQALAQPVGEMAAIDGIEDIITMKALNI